MLELQRLKENTNNISDFGIDSCSIFGVKSYGTFRYIKGLVMLRLVVSQAAPSRILAVGYSERIP